MNSNTINTLLATLGLHPVLVDVGASDAPPAVWNPIAAHAIYVGFDPDSRELHETAGGHFYKSITVNEAVTDRADAGEVAFHFTRSPFCSSTLEPDIPALSNYIFADLFQVERTTSVRASTLEAIAARTSLPGIDWLKVDSQGTDLRIFESMGAALKSHVLALDIEPGLIDAYAGEDHFVDAHKQLTREGFWLSDCNVKGTVRMRRATLEGMSASMPGDTEKMVRRTFKKSPAWCEARYLRTLEALEANGCGTREYVLAWVFGLLDDQLGYAIDIEAEYERRFGADAALGLMRGETRACVARNQRRLRRDLALSIPGRIWRRVFS